MSLKYCVGLQPPQVLAALPPRFSRRRSSTAGLLFFMQAALLSSPSRGSSSDGLLFFYSAQARHLLIFTQAALLSSPSRVAAHLASFVLFSACRQGHLSCPPLVDPDPATATTGTILSARPCRGAAFVLQTQNIYFPSPYIRKHSVLD